MRILVTGGAGYIGSHTSLALLNAGYEVVILDNFSNSSSKSVERIMDLSGRSAVLVEGDICNHIELRNLFQKNKKSTLSPQTSVNLLDIDTPNDYKNFIKKL